MLLALQWLRCNTRGARVGLFQVKLQLLHGFQCFTHRFLEFDRVLRFAETGPSVSRKGVKRSYLSIQMFVRSQIWMLTVFIVDLLSKRPALLNLNRSREP